MCNLVVLLNSQESGGSQDEAFAQLHLVCQLCSFQFQKALLTFIHCLDYLWNGIFKIQMTKLYQISVSLFSQAVGLGIG